MASILKTPELIPDVTKSTIALAKIIGHRTDSISDAVKKGELVAQSNGHFLKEDVIRWLKTKRSRTKKPEAEKWKETEVDDLPDRGASDAEYAHWRAKKEKINVLTMRGKLLPKSEVSRAFTSRAYELSRDLQMLARRITHLICAKTKQETKAVSAIINKEVRKMLEQYSRPIQIETEE